MTPSACRCFPVCHWWCDQPSEEAATSISLVVPAILLPSPVLSLVPPLLRNSTTRQWFRWFSSSTLIGETLLIPIRQQFSATRHLWCWKRHQHNQGVLNASIVGGAVTTASPSIPPPRCSRPEKHNTSFF